jgi:hypothetical protein
MHLIDPVASLHYYNSWTLAYDHKELQLIINYRHTHPRKFALFHKKEIQISLPSNNISYAS